MTDRQIAKCYKIAQHYGKGKQKIQAAQELNELQALLLRRPDQIQNKAEHIENLIDEIADVEIMIEQLRQLYEIGNNEIHDRINFKLNRQIDRIREEG